VIICGGGGYPSFYHYIFSEFIFFSKHVFYNQKFRKKYKYFQIWGLSIEGASNTYLGSGKVFEQGI